MKVIRSSLTNLTYPIYLFRSYIKHFSPGKWWDSLYTWDAGFVGLGLLEIDERNAIECLNTYTTEEDNPHTAFIHWGSVVPVQHYLFQEIWNRTQSMPLLTHFYPRLRGWYRYYAGHAKGSTMNHFASDLLAPWDYFYNAGGWDDYPPQEYLHKQKIACTVAPVATTAHAIRIAKILKAFATHLRIDKDVTMYEKDIARFTDALQKYSWDKNAGYFGYVVHDDAGVPETLLRTQEGVNYNMGMGGAYPLVAGICTDDQERALIEKCTSSEHLWTSIGLSAVDRSAPYYSRTGYWNGSIWFPHQWFFWKTMLDLGKQDIAYRIAETALALWKREVEYSYNCYEHFMIDTEAGAGWHQFTSLSSPVMKWYRAYFAPGTVTAGFDTTFLANAFSSAKDFFKGTFVTESANRNSHHGFNLENMTGGLTTIVVENNTISNITGDTGISISASGADTGIIVSSNTVAKADAQGIHIVGVDDATIIFNTVTNVVNKSLYVDNVPAGSLVIDHNNLYRSGDNPTANACLKIDNVTGVLLYTNFFGTRALQTLVDTGTKVFLSNDIDTAIATWAPSHINKAGKLPATPTRHLMQTA